MKINIVTSRSYLCVICESSENKIVRARKFEYEIPQKMWNLFLQFFWLILLKLHRQSAENFSRIYISKLILRVDSARISRLWVNQLRNSEWIYKIRPYSDRSFRRIGRLQVDPKRADLQIPTESSVNCRDLQHTQRWFTAEFRADRPKSNESSLDIRADPAQTF